MFWLSVAVYIRDTLCMALLLKASRVITPIVLCLRFTYKMLKLNKIEIKDKDFIVILKDFIVIFKNFIVRIVYIS